MKRVSCTPRIGFKQKVQDLGLLWHSADDDYWHEKAYYSFTSSEIAALETATEELHQMFIAAGQYVVDNPSILVDRFDIPASFVPAIIDSWNNEPACLNYGRFDLGFDGVNPPKLFEYNCDTPTSMLEAGVIQWKWKEEMFPFSDQFNSLHEKLVDAYRRLDVKEMYFTGVHDNNGEDAVTVGYHMDLAAEAGITPYSIHMSDIGYNSATGEFVDLDNNPMYTVFKLYPWEWMVHEEFGRHIVNSSSNWIEPIWKMIWSNKAILPILWQLFPNHPNLLEASFEPLEGDYVTKPTLAREGANVTIRKNGEIIATEGEYGEGRMIHQRLYNVPNFDGFYPVIGSWCVDGYAAGMGIRDSGLITNNVSRFTPHIIREF